MASGRSYEQIEEMTLFDVGILFEYWVEHPTADDILKAVYKIETKKTPPETPQGNTDPSGIGGLIAAFPHGLVPAAR
jgi:hypothetical protein